MPRTNAPPVVFVGRWCGSRWSAPTIPAGAPVLSVFDPVPAANAASSSRSFASTSSFGSWSPNDVSSITSNEPYSHAAAFFGYTTTDPNVGEASPAPDASVSHAA